MSSTSKQSWDQLRDSGDDKKLRAIALAGIRHLWNCTGKELYAYTGIEGIHKRLSELEEDGVIVCVGTRICGHTGRNAKAYEPNDPENPRESVRKAKSSKDQEIDELKAKVSAQQAEIAVLQARLREYEGGEGQINLF